MFSLQCLQAELWLASAYIIEPELCVNDAGGDSDSIWRPWYDLLLTIRHSDHLIVMLHTIQPLLAILAWLLTAYRSASKGITGDIILLWRSLGICFWCSLKARDSLIVPFVEFIVFFMIFLSTGAQRRQQPVPAIPAVTFPHLTARRAPHVE